MQKGDIVLIPFPFTDLSGNKLRPAVILVNSKLDITVCFITSQLQWQDSNDILLQPKSSNGLKKTSLIKISKIATLVKTLALGKIGNLDENELTALNSGLMQLFNLS